jgi:hypothetical protein
MGQGGCGQETGGRRGMRSLNDEGNGGGRVVGAVLGVMSTEGRGGIRALPARKRGQ